ncbi:DNA polymerase III subunit delta' [Elongatibacter sediminis]|uniref:DNA-directed DNA polymerase n=1 Tax=Elongatibacter sediminis TaxID=3119006 RepID=A0AAW9R9G6_9GAMM
MTYPWLTEAEARLARNATEDRQAHALLFSGPAGLGKVGLALGEARDLLCLEQTRPACGTCRSCQLMQGGAHPDFRRVTFEPNDKGQMRKEIVVDQIRALITSLQLTNTLSQRKVAIVHPAEAMNRNAANALLKTLEEPAGDVVLILVSHDEARLPATVRSRCQSVAIRQPETTEAADWLAGQAGTDRESALLALEAGAGSPLQAAELLDSGRIDDFRQLCEALDRLATEPGGATDAFTRLMELDSAECWRWLSLASAARARRRLSREAESAGISGLLHLNALANRNLRLVATPVRQDLLLRDWLVQWQQTAGR